VGSKNKRKWLLPKTLILAIVVLKIVMLKLSHSEKSVTSVNTISV